MINSNMYINCDCDNIAS